MSTRSAPMPGRLTFVERLYDPDFFARNYVVVDGVPNKRDPETGKLYPTRRQFEEGFEDAAGVEDLIGPERGWTSFTLQSPAAPTIPEYNALRQRIMSGRGDFLDNRVEIEPEFAHSGKRSLKCTSAPPSRGMTTAKASLTSSLMHFVKGDDVWYLGLVPGPRRAEPAVHADGLGEHLAQGASGDADHARPARPPDARTEVGGQAEVPAGEGT